MDSKILHKIANKLGKLLKSMDELSDEEIGYKLQNICWHSQKLKSDDDLIKFVKTQLKLASTSIEGDLSLNSTLNLENLLNEIHAFIKAYELIVYVKAAQDYYNKSIHELNEPYVDNSGYIVEEQDYYDESIRELYESYVDSSGYIVEELNSHVKDKIYPILAKKFYDENSRLDHLLLEANDPLEKALTK